jgi:diguanylate cyclase (GGDEF)-like protein/PAS domain S-box-containing protein
MTAAMDNDVIFKGYQLMGLSDKRLFEQGPVICFTRHLAPGWPLLSVTDNINQFGYEAESFLSEKRLFTQIVHPEDIERITAEVNMCLTTNTESLEQDYRIITRSGDVRRVYDKTIIITDEQGEKTIAQGYLLDITDRKRKKPLFKNDINNEQLFRTVIETTSEGFLMVDNDFNITFANHALCHLTGYELAELKGLSAIDYVTPEFKHTFTPQLNRRDIQLHRDEDLIIRHKSGQEINVRLTATTMRDGCGFFAFVTNITTHKKTEIQLLKLSRAVEHSASSIMITDKHGIIEYINPRFCEVTGYSESEAVGQTPSIISTKETPPACHQELWSTILAGNNWHGETFNRTKHGAYYWSLMSISPVMDDQGEISHFISVSEDITTQKDQQIKIEKIALYDPLTGLANRRLLYDRLNQSTEILQRQQDTGIGVIMLDLDYFKAINDTYGHDVGDELLKEVGLRLTDCVRSEDTVSRPGGDEFTILLQDVTHPEDIRAVAQKILQSVRRSINIDKYSFKITCSIGISIAPLHTYEPKVLLKYADLALYRAKDSGRDNFQFFDTNMQVKHQGCMQRV